MLHYFLGTWLHGWSRIFCSAIRDSLLGAWYILDNPVVWKGVIYVETDSCSFGFYDSWLLALSIILYHFVRMWLC